MKTITHATNHKVYWETKDAINQALLALVNANETYKFDKTDIARLEFVTQVLPTFKTAKFSPKAFEYRCEDIQTMLDDVAISGELVNPKYFLAMRVIGTLLATIHEDVTDRRASLETQSRGFGI